MFAFKNGKLIITIGHYAIKAFYATLALLLAAVLVGCLLYIALAYETLATWYLSLNNCFYNVNTWQNNFFSPATKSTGNLFAVLGTIIAIFGIYVATRKFKKAKRLPISIDYSTKHILWYTAVAVLGIGASLWEWQLMAPSYDEIFSAVNCAELHPFQTCSYYMLPNNHLLFNIVNSILFGWHQHLVGTGRLISLAAYTCTLLIAFNWLSKQTKSNTIAFVALLPVAFQFIVWGMSAQARGYEFQLLCGWIAFITLTYKGNDYRSTALNAVVNIAGFALIPSWFYFYSAQLLYATGKMLNQKRISWRYWKYQLAVIASTFLFYIPGICFSGTSALSGNRYVKASTDSLYVFTTTLLPLGRNFVSYCFSHLASEGSILSYLLFILPLVLLCFRSRRHLGEFYIATWVAFILCSLFIKHIPFHRTLIIQFSVTIALAAYTLWVLLGYVFDAVAGPKASLIARSILFVTPTLALSVWFIQYNKENINFGLYSNDVNGLYGMHMGTISSITPGSSIAFSDESFYFFYHCRRMGYKVSRCATGKEQYFVKRTDEPLPALYKADYVLFKKAAEDYEVYSRK
jgi:hypothetical protein